MQYTGTCSTPEQGGQLTEKDGTKTHAQSNTDACSVFSRACDYCCQLPRPNAAHKTPQKLKHISSRSRDEMPSSALRHTTKPDRVIKHAHSPPPTARLCWRETMTSMCWDAQNVFTLFSFRWIPKTPPLLPATTGALFQSELLLRSAENLRTKHHTHESKRGWKRAEGRPPRWMRIRRRRKPSRKRCSPSYSLPERTIRCCY